MPFPLPNDSGPGSPFLSRTSPLTFYPSIPSELEREEGRSKIPRKDRALRPVPGRHEVSRETGNDRRPLDPSTPERGVVGPGLAGPDPLSWAVGRSFDVARLSWKEQRLSPSRPRGTAHVETVTITRASVEEPWPTLRVPRYPGGTPRGAPDRALQSPRWYYVLGRDPGDPPGSGSRDKDTSEPRSYRGCDVVRMASATTYRTCRHDLLEKKRRHEDPTPRDN